MSLVALLNLRSDEVILIAALILILLGGKKLPELGEGLRLGIKEFSKAVRRVTEQITGDDDDDDHPIHPVLMLLTFLFGTSCLIIVVYEFTK